MRVVTLTADDRAGRPQVRPGARLLAFNRADFHPTLRGHAQAIRSVLALGRDELDVI